MTDGPAAARRRRRAHPGADPDHAGATGDPAERSRRPLAADRRRSAGRWSSPRVARGGGAAGRRPGAGGARGAVRAARGARPACTGRRRVPRLSTPSSTTSRCTRARAPRRGSRSPTPTTSSTSTRAAGRPPYVAMRPHGGQVGRLLGPAAAGRRDQPAALGPPVARRGEGRADDAVGGLPVRAGHARRPADAGAADDRAVRLAGRRAAAARPRRRAPLAAAGQRHRARRHPAVPAGRPAAPDQLAGLAADPASCTWSRTRAEEDTGVLLVVDALADHGASGGVDGAASSLDLTVRAAAAIAEHHVRAGRPGGAAGGRPRPASWSGTAPAPGTCGGSRTPWPALRTGERRRGRRRRRCSSASTGGTVVIVLSPMLAESIGAVAATLTRRGVPVLVVDTLPPDAAPARAEGIDPRAGGPRLADAPPRADGRAATGSPRSAARWCPGAGRAPSTTCCAGWPGARSSPGWWPGERVLTPVRRASQLVLRALVAPRPGRRRCSATGPAGTWPPWWVVGAGARARCGVRGAARVAVRCRRCCSPCSSGGPLALDDAAPGGRGRGRRPAGRPRRRGAPSYGPAAMPLDAAAAAAVGAPRRRWCCSPSRRPGVLARLLHGEPEQPGIWVLGVAAALVATVAATVALGRRRDRSR